ncbi:hypothetical protein MBLNU230_g5940t1 [Neophaeotheca triangularis]
MDEQIGTFCAFTSATPQQAQQYLALTDGNTEQAVELYFNDPNLGASAPAPAASTTGQNQDRPITIDDDDDEMDLGDDDMPRAGGSAAQAGQPSVEDDEAMAKRLQEEMYGGGGSGGGGAAGLDDVDEEGVRAPMARRTETLAGPDADWRDDPTQMRAAIAEQMAARQQRRAAPGIFNQRPASSIWNEDDLNNPEAHRQALSRATGGASEQTSKSNLLADLFRPPFELIANLDWSSARDEGKENEKWIIVNVQDPSIFDCQVLNRDIWKNPSIKETIQEHFIFMQFNKADPQGQEYIQYYFANMRDNEDAYPHIAIVDPRTGEQVKSWSGSPAPKASDFLMDLHEFLDRYSLKMDQKNPVQAKRKEKKKDIAQMSEEEMLEMAMKNSIGGGGAASKEEDPDALTKAARASNGRASVPEVADTADMGPVASNEGAPGPRSGSLASPNKEDDDTPFSRISATNPHTEPDASVPAPETTRIQFRYSGGRVVRKFLLSDPVRRIYEWLKAEPVAGKEDQSFELISMGVNLMSKLEQTIQEAGLKNATVMVEFSEADD